MKRKAKSLLCMAKRLRPYKVIHVTDGSGNYIYSILEIFTRISGKPNNFIRIKFDKRECTVEGDIDTRMKENILKK